MKKFAVIALAAVMLLSTLAGCGANAEGEASVQSVSMICGLGSTGLVDRFAGMVTAQSETQVKKDDNATVDTILVKVDQEVKAGDALFTYDMSQATLDLEKAQLELDNLKNELESKKQEKEQLEKDKNAASSDDQMQYTLEIRQVNADILQKEYDISVKAKDIEKLQNTVKNVTVTSPVTGRVKSINEKGGTDQTGNPLPFMTIVETGGFRVKGYVNENNAAALREGTEVIIRSRVSDQTWKGSVDTVDWNNPVQQQSYYDSDTSLSSKYPFYVALDEGDGLLLGQHVYIEPDYGQEDEQDASAINLPSYFISDPDGKPWVWAQSSKGKLEKRDLKLGEYNADTDTYPVLEGLTAEDYIAYPDESLKAGMACVTYDDATFDPGTNGGTNGGVDGGMIDGSADVPTDEGGYVDGGQRVDGDDSGVVTMPAVEG
mgnify:CR=1 FL=1